MAGVRAGDRRDVVDNVDVVIDGLVPTSGNWRTCRSGTALPRHKRPLLRYTQILWNCRLLLAATNSRSLLLLICIVISCTVRVIGFIGL